MDEATVLVLALMDKLREKKHSLGAARALDPILTQADVEAILKRQQDVMREMRGETKGGIVLPPGAKL